jgi:uncharacterized protein (TIGR02996 family)
MRDEDHFIRAIKDNPDDGVARLIYADWLEERKDLRAEYLRLEHQWAQMRLCFAQLRDSGERSEPWRLGLAELPLRLAQLREQIDSEWLRALSGRRRETIGFWNLPWREIDPRIIAFDSEVVRPHLEEVLTHIVRKPHMHRWEHAALIGEVIIATYGPWASGWDFSVGEGGGGGVLDPRNWCCPEHSLFRGGYSVDKVAEHADRITRAICEWRNHLGRLADLFEAVCMPGTTKGGETQLAIRRAFGRLVTWVIELTNCDDAWYNYLERTLSWLLEYLGMEPGDAAKIVGTVLNGRFHSWIQPGPEELEQAADSLALLAAQHLDRSERGE